MTTAKRANFMWWAPAGGHKRIDNASRAILTESRGQCMCGSLAHAEMEHQLEPPSSEQGAETAEEAPAGGGAGRRRSTAAVMPTAMTVAWAALVTQMLDHLSGNRAVRHIDRIGSISAGHAQIAADCAAA